MATDRDRGSSSLSLLANAAILSILFGLVGYALSFLTNILLARSFSPSEYGAYSLALTFLSFLGLIALIGIPTGIPRFVPLYLAKKDHASLAGYLRFVLLVPLILSLAFGVTFFLLRQRIAAFFGVEPAFAALFVLVAILLPFRISTDIFDHLLTARRMIKATLVRYHLIEKGTFLFLVLLILLLKLPLAWLLGALLLSILCSILYALARLRWRDFSVAPRYHVGEWLRFSLPLFLSGFFTLFITWSDRLIIARFLTTADVGVYSVALSLVMLLTFFQTTMASLFLPLISEHYALEEHAQISFLFRKAAVWTFALTFPLFLVMLLFAQQLLGLFYGAAYVVGYPALVILSFGFLINVTTGLNKEILLLHGRTRFLLILNVALAMLNILLAVLLLPRFGIVGAAVSSSAVMALDNLLCLFFARRHERLSFDVAVTAKCVVASLIAFFCAFAIFRLDLPLLARFFVSGAVYAFVYALGLLLLRCIGNEEVRLLLDVERRFGLDLSWFKRRLRRFVG